jgi:hypothetical protein
VANSDTTENLLNQDFSTWSGTNTARHGNDTVAGVHGQYVESTISLNNDAGLSKEVINNGFTSTLGADIWFWNSYDQSVVMTQTLVDDNGNVTTQSRTIDRQDGYFTTYTDSIYIDSVTQQDYSISAKFSFFEESNSPYHYAADLKNPTLFIEYDPVVVDETTQSEIITISKSIEDIKIVDTFEEVVIEDVVIQPIIQEQMVDEIIVADLTDEEEFVEENIILSTELNNDDIIQEDEKTEEELEEGCSGCTDNETTEVVEETERDTRLGEDTGNTIETESTGVSESTQDDSRGIETELTIEDISIKVAEKIKTVDGQLIATQILTAKAMQKPSKINKYAQVNSDIFIQPELQSIDIGTYTNNTYVDIRNIYSNQSYEDRLWTSRQ